MKNKLLLFLDKASQSWWLMFLIQIIICLIAFNKAYSNHNDFLFANWYDAMKNYFIMDGYLHHDSLKGVLHYNQMNYPFGEYIYYTDNTPLFCLIIKLFSRYFFDITPWFLELFHLLVALNILIVARLSWVIVRRFIDLNWLRFILALCIPWTNLQVMRIQTTSNLSYSAIILTCIYLLILIYENRFNRKKIFRYWAVMFVFCSMSFFIHGYYILLIAVPVFSFHFFWILIRKGKEGLLVKIGGVIVPVVSIIVSYSVIYFTDPWLNLRPKQAGGFDWMDWKTQFLGLFTAYDFQFIKYPLSTFENIPFESHEYLGAFILYGSSFLLLYFLYHEKLRVSLKKFLLKDEKSRLLVLLFFTGLFSLIISFGNEYWLTKTGVRFYNVLNPFYWMIDYFPMITQFRVVGRLSWIFFFPTIILVAYLLEKSKVEWKSSRYLKIVSVILCFFLLSDTYGYVKNLNRNVIASNPISIERTGRIKIGNINAKEYQAILPIPFYCIGSEDAGYSIDPDDSWATLNFALSKKTDLPLMSALLGRTSDYQSRSLINIFLNYKMDSTLNVYMNDKPILVAVRIDFKDSQNDIHTPQYEPALTAYKNMKGFADSLKLEKVFSDDQVEYYKWNIKN